MREILRNHANKNTVGSMIKVYNKMHNITIMPLRKRADFTLAGHKMTGK